MSRLFRHPTKSGYSSSETSSTTDCVLQSLNFVRLDGVIRAIQPWCSGDKVKILIGYDGSKYADAALEDLRRAGLGAEAEALVMTVADIFVPLPIEEALFSTESLLSRQDHHQRTQTLSCPFTTGPSTKPLSCECQPESCR